MQANLDSSCHTCSRQAILRDMLQTYTLGKTIQVDEEQFGNGSQCYQLKIRLHDQSSPRWLLKIYRKVTGDKCKTTCQAESIRMRLIIDFRQPQPVQRSRYYGTN